MKKKFFNYPAKIERKSYDLAQDELIKNFSQNKDVLAIYNYGTIKTVGVSDLDIIVVVKGDLTHSTVSNYSVEPKRFPIVSSLQRGTLMVMAEKDFKNINWLDEGITLNCIYGDDIEVTEIDKKYYESRILASIIDWLPERMGVIARTYKEDVVNFTFSLRILRSYGYTLEKIFLLTGDKKYKAFVDSVINLRNDWSNKEREIIELLEDSISLGLDAQKEIAEKYFKDEVKGGGYLFLSDNSKMVFTSDYDKLSKEFILNNSFLKQSVIPVMSELAGHFSFYSKQSGILAEQMERQMSLPDIDLSNILYCDFLAKKMEVATNMADFLLRNNFTTGLFRFQFYLSNHIAKMKKTAL